MSTCTHDNAVWMEPSAIAIGDRQGGQKARIMEALGLIDDSIPNVDDETLFRYYEYLSANLSFPFTAYYPHPTNAKEQRDFSSDVLELLDPATHFGDQFDGIFCKTCKGKYELNLPLIELELPQGSPNCQLIEDFWYWFWNWR